MFPVIHIINTFKGIYVLTTMRNHSSANGQGAAKVLRGSMTANATSSCIQTTAHSLATVAGSPLRGLMRSIVTVRDLITLLFYRDSDRMPLSLVRSEGGSGCMKSQDSSMDQQPAYTKVEPDVGGPDWGDYNGVGVTV